MEDVNGVDPDAARNRPHFERLTPIFPEEQIRLETERTNLSTRLMDLVSPIGRGQRGMIVSPPKAGKTTLLKNIQIKNWASKFGFRSVYFIHLISTPLRLLMEATHFWPLQQAYTHPTLLWSHLQLAIFFTMIMPTAILRVKKKRILNIQNDL